MLIASLLIASAGLSAVLIINQSAKQSYTNKQSYFVPNVSHRIINNSSEDKISKQDYAQLRQKGFTALVAIAQFRSHVYSTTNSENTASTNVSAATKLRVSSRAIDFTGVDTSALLSLTPNISHGNQPPINTDSSKQNTLNQDFILSGNSVLNYQLVAFGHPALIEELQGSSTEHLLTSENESLPRLISLEADFLGNDIVMDMSVFFTSFSDAHITQLLLAGPISPAEITRLQQALPTYLSLEQIKQQDQGELTESFHLNLLAMALLMFAVCLFIVLNAAQLLLDKRMPWLKVCRQLGISRVNIAFFQVIEIITITAVACVLGVILGVQLSILVSPAVQATLEGLYQVQIGFGNISALSLFLKVYAISAIGALSAFVLPLQQMNQRLSQKSVSDIAWRNPIRQSVTALSVGVLLSLCALFIFQYSQNLGLLLAATAALILTGCGVLIALFPYILKTLAKAIPKQYSLLKVSVNQSLSLSGKTKIACCAFFIAATSNIGMNLMVDSFRGATNNWLSQRLAAPHYLYYAGQESLVDAFQQASSDGTRFGQISLTPRYEHTVEYKQQTVQSYSYPDTQQMRDALAFESKDSIDIWQAFNKGTGVFVNQQFAIRNSLTIKDTVQLDFPSTYEYQILGIFYDYGNPSAQVLFPISRFEQAMSGTSSQTFASTIFAVNHYDGNSPSAVNFRQWLETLEIDHQQQLLATEQLLALSMNTFDRTFLITDGLNIVTLLVAALSLACAIIVLMSDTRPQRMLLRSMGVSKLQNQLLAYAQYLLLCLVALLMATPFGMLLSHVLIYEINYQAFQWTYPLQINWLKLLNVYWLSLLVVSIVILLPIIQIGRRPLISDIRQLN